MAAVVEPRPADAHDAGPALAFNVFSPSWCSLMLALRIQWLPSWSLAQLMLMMPVLRWHLMEPPPADAHDAGTAVAFNSCLGGAYPS